MDNTSSLSTLAFHIRFYLSSLLCLYLDTPTFTALCSFILHLNYMDVCYVFGLCEFDMIIVYVFHLCF